MLIVTCQVLNAAQASCTANTTPWLVGKIGACLSPSLWCTVRPSMPSSLLKSTTDLVHLQRCLGHTTQANWRALRTEGQIRALQVGVFFAFLELVIKALLLAKKITILKIGTNSAGRQSTVQLQLGSVSSTREQSPARALHNWGQFKRKWETMISQ